MSDHSELKRLADACPPPGTYHYQSKEWANLMAFQAAVEDIYESDVGMAKELISEVEALRSQVATLQSDANSWQSGYDEGRRMGTKTAMDERESLRKDAERYRYWRSHTESFFLKRGENLDLAERNDRFIDAAMGKEVKTK